MQLEKEAEVSYTYALDIENLSLQLEIFAVLIQHRVICLLLERIQKCRLSTSQYRKVVGRKLEK